MLTRSNKDKTTAVHQILSESIHKKHCPLSKSVYFNGDFQVWRRSKPAGVEWQCSNLTVKITVCEWAAVRQRGCFCATVSTIILTIKCLCFGAAQRPYNVWSWHVGVVGGDGLIHLSLCRLVITYPVVRGSSVEAVLNTTEQTWNHKVILG